jgi:hypothetical protein
MLIASLINAILEIHLCEAGQMDLESYPNKRAISRKRREWLGDQVPAQLDLMRVKGEGRNQAGS